MKTMRQITFRAWSNRDKCWCGAFSVHKSGLFTEMSGAKMENGVCTAYADWIDLSKQDEIDLMQYTGLKDKNGKEIYEGDLYDCWSEGTHHIGVITWGVAGFFIKIPPPKSIWYLSGGTEPGEVVGNIYENPAMLLGWS